MQNKAIYQQLSGRLGNQLFQWAYGHQLSAQYGSLVIPFHDNSHSVGGYLGNLESFINPCRHLGDVKNINSFGLILKVLDKIGMYSSNLPPIIESYLGIYRTTHHFEVPLLLQRKPRMVTGFFVNWESVLGIEETLFEEMREGFECVKLPSGLPSRYQVIHVRRGDFVGLKETHGILHPEYYANNIQSGIDTFICTDDNNLAQDIQRKLKIQKVFGPDDLSPIAAMKFMANAEVLLMSNSTLSWWAGFYSARKGGKVVIPKPFYKIEEHSSLHHPDFTTAPAVFY